MPEKKKLTVLKSSSNVFWVFLATLSGLFICFGVSYCLSEQLSNANHREQSLTAERVLTEGKPSIGIARKNASLAQKLLQKTEPSLNEPNVDDHSFNQRLGIVNLILLPFVTGAIATLSVSFLKTIFSLSLFLIKERQGS